MGAWEAPAPRARAAGGTCTIGGAAWDGTPSPKPPPASLGGQHGRPAGNPHRGLACEGGDGPCCSARTSAPCGSGRARWTCETTTRAIGWRAGARSAERHRDAPAGAAHKDVAAAIETVRDSKSAQPAVRLAFEFLVLTAARSGELRLATRDEGRGRHGRAGVDHAGHAGMKAKDEHRVPMCGRPVEVLNAAHALADGSRVPRSQSDATGHETPCMDGSRS